jgi:hypothetical protein
MGGRVGKVAVRPVPTRRGLRKTATRRITVTLDDALFERARAFVARRRTSLGAVVRDFLSHLAKDDERIAEARRGLLELIDNSTGRLGPKFSWNREAVCSRRGKR